MKRFLWAVIFTWGCVTDVAPAVDSGASSADGQFDAAPSVMQRLDGGEATDGVAPADPMDGANGDVDARSTLPPPADASPTDAQQMDTAIVDAAPTAADAAPMATDAETPGPDAEGGEDDAEVMENDAAVMDMAVPEVLYDPLPICINEFAPKVSGYGSDSPLDWIELFNPTMEEVNLEGWSISDDREVPDKHVFGDLVVPAGGALLLYADTQPARGPNHLPFRLASGGEEIMLTAPDGRAQLVSYDALTVDVTPGRIPDCCVGEDCWQFAYLGTPGRGNVVGDEEEIEPIEANSAWRYFIGDVEDNWRTADHDDREWGEGDGPLGWGDNHIANEIERPGGVVVVYFRKTFELDRIDGLQDATFTLLVDDGAVVYLNGQEAFRTRMPAGEIRPNTLATETAGGPAETARTPFPIPVDDFREGINIIAVEVHQAAPNSSDLGFDGSLRIRRIESARPAPPGPPSPDLVRIEPLPVPADLSGWIFGQEQVHRMDLLLPAQSIEALRLAPSVPVVSELRLDGQRVPEVGVHIRGSGEAFRPLGDKPLLHLDFEHFAPDRNVYGLTSLTLNHGVQDCSRMREVLGYGIFSAAGVPAPRAAFVQLTINGEDYGLYSLVETEDKVWLERHYGAASEGNLYDGRAQTDAMGNPVFLDFERESIRLFPRIEGEGAQRDDLRGVVDAITGNAGRPTFYETVGEVIDWETFHGYAAAEIWLGHALGYLSNRDNYRVYFDPADEKMDFAPWGLEKAFEIEDGIGCGFETPCGLLAELCWADEDCLAAQRATILALDDTLRELNIVNHFDSLSASSIGAARADPLGECPRTPLNAARLNLRDWLGARSEAIRAQWTP